MEIWAFSSRLRDAGTVIWRVWAAFGAPKGQGKDLLKTKKRPQTIEARCAHVEPGVAGGGGVRLGGGSDSCFLPLLTQLSEVTGSGGNWRGMTSAEHPTPWKHSEDDVCTVSSCSNAPYLEAPSDHPPPTPISA